MVKWLQCQHHLFSFAGASLDFEEGIPDTASCSLIRSPSLSLLLEVIAVDPVPTQALELCPRPYLLL